MSSAEQVVVLLTRIAESLDTQTELLSALLARKKNAEVKPPEASGDASKTHRTFTAEYIEVGFEKGKKTFKIFGFPFKKHGVRVWPEVLPKLGLPIDLDLGQHPIEKWVVAELNDEGNPQKVIGLAP